MIAEFILTYDDLIKSTFFLFIIKMIMMIFGNWEILL